MTEELVTQLKRHEGSRRDPRGNHVAYICPAGALTIGYGHNLSANPIPGLGPGSIIDEQRAEDILRADIAEIEKQLRRNLPWFDRIDPVRQDVLLNMGFNLGLKGLLGFRNTLAAVACGEYRDAAERMLQSLWARQVKGRAAELAGQMLCGLR